MQLNNEKIKILRKSFDEIDAFKNLDSKKVEQILNKLVEFYIELAKINLRIKKEENEKGK